MHPSTQQDSPDVRHLAPVRPERTDRLGDPVARRRRDLDLRLVEIVLDVRARVTDRREHARARVRERVRHGVDEEQLFLHADPELGQ